ncbi:MAG TPA: aspartyl-phosphate phosphatase Spo0E family protein [Clostridia bacterium]
MHELKDLIRKIQDLREHLDKLVVQKGNLLDPEIIAASRLVDKLLNEYEKLVSEKDRD